MRLMLSSLDQQQTTSTERTKETAKVKLRRLKLLIPNRRQARSTAPKFDQTTRITLAITVYLSAGDHM